MNDPIEREAEVSQFLKDLFARKPPVKQWYPQESRYVRKKLAG